MAAVPVSGGAAAAPAPAPAIAAVAPALPSAFTPSRAQTVATMSVPKPIWAGVIQLFFMILNAFSFVGLLGATGAIGSSSAFNGPPPERIVALLFWALLFYIVQFCIQLPVAIGLFALKRWAYGLYLWTIAPLWIIFAGLIVAASDSVPSAPISDATVPIIVTAVILGLLGLQIYLVASSKRQLVN
jgi:hypothetical protein